MKKLTLTLAIVLGMTVGAMAQGGLFQRGYSDYDSDYMTNNDRTGSLLSLPSHGSTEDVDATPIGSGIAVLVGLGAAYAVAKKRKED